MSPFQSQRNSIKVLVDAAIFQEHNAIALGILARNSDREVIFARTVRHQGMVGPDMTEAMAIKEALSWCKETNTTDQEVMIESDCLVIVLAIRIAW